MKGMELARAYYDEYGAQIRSSFPGYENRMAFGLVGEGSECYGYDDDLSQDHDFGPGFCIWITRDTARAIGPELVKAYEELPAQFMGYRREVTPEGAGRTGVIPIDRFFIRFTNVDGVPGTNMEWLRIPERFLSIATNGQVFDDPEGVFTATRNALMQFYPQDVLRKKLAARAAVCSQSGQYNFPRCAQRGEREAAWLSVGEFVPAALSACYLLERKYMPFYKWAFRGTDQLTTMSPVVSQLRQLVAIGNDPAQDMHKQQLIEGICGGIAVQLRAQGLSNTDDPFLQAHLPSIMGGITDPQIKALHVMADAD